MKSDDHKAAKRLFLGIPLSDRVRNTAKHFRETHHRLSGIRWVSAENLHITTCFFGQVPVEQIENLQELIQEGLKHHPPFELQFRNYCFAPRPKDPRMIWIRFFKQEAFSQLVRHIDQLYQQIQPNQHNRKSPIPHITLARLRNFTSHEEVEFPREFPEIPLKVKELFLWESELKPSGAIYHPVAQFRLS